MLYYRDSFNYYVNLGIVRRLRAHLLRTELGVKIAGIIFGETAQNLRRHAELIREGHGSYIEMQDVLNRNTDGPENPLSQVFSRAERARQMFWQFKNVQTEVMFWNPNWLPVIGKLLPHAIEERFASCWGWHLWIYAQKRYLEFTVLKEIPYPEHFGVNVARQFLPRRSSCALDRRRSLVQTGERVTFRQLRALCSRKSLFVQLHRNQPWGILPIRRLDVLHLRRSVFQVLTGL